VVEELRHGSRKHGRWWTSSQLAWPWLSVIVRVRSCEGVLAYPQDLSAGGEAITPPLVGRVTAPLRFRMTTDD
jgi:hypothetical protein